MSTHCRHQKGAEETKRPEENKTIHSSNQSNVLSSVVCSAVSDVWNTTDLDKNHGQLSCLVFFVIQPQVNAVKVSLSLSLSVNSLFFIFHKHKISELHQNSSVNKR